MKSKVFSFLSMLVMLFISMGAWADTVVLSAPAPADKNVLSDASGIVTLTDKAEKGGIQDGSGTIQGKTPLKLSGSRQFILTYSSSVTINSVKVYATTNSTSAGTAGKTTDDKTSYGAVSAKEGTPVEFSLTGVSGEGFTFSTQSLAVIVVDYTSNGGSQDGGDTGGNTGGDTGGNEPTITGNIAFNAADFADAKDLTTGTTVINGTTWYGGGGAAYAAGSQTFGDDVKWDGRVKFGGKSTFQSGSTLSRVISFNAPSDGTVKVYAVTGSSGKDRYVYVSQSMTKTALDETTALVKANTNPECIATAEVKAGVVYVWSNDNIGIYGVTFEGSAAGGNEGGEENPGGEQGGEQKPTLITDLADVTAPTTWDWTKTGETAIQLTDATDIKKSDEFVLSNLIPSTEAFNSAALKIQAEYAVRDGKYMQGGKVMFHTTIPGTIKVKFSNTGNRLLEDKKTEDESLRRWLYVNGTKTAFGSCTATAMETEAIEVEAGDVVLTSMIDGDDANQYLRIYSIEFAEKVAGGEENPGGEQGGDEPAVDPADAHLIWDYTEAAPSAKPDNGLSYDQTINDAAGKNNGLKGVKMNSSGYAYFTKASVAGTLKLTFGPRTGNSATKLAVSTYTSDPKAETLIANTKEVTELSTDAIELTAEQNNIYINRASGAEAALTKIEFVPAVQRTFQDFEMVLGGLSKEYDASALPAGVKFEGTYNSDSHGYRNAVVTVPVDGTVKFTYSSCSYGSQKFSVKDADGNVVASDLSLTLGENSCYHQKATNVLTYIYTGKPTTLTFGPIQYLAYFKAEAAEVAPCKVTYKDQNGNVIGTVDTFEGEALGEIPYSAKDITVPAGSAFRGWVYASQVKAKAADVLSGNTTITALVTPIERVSNGSVQTYNLTSNIFYPEDHETISITDGYYHDGQHGWAVATGGEVSVDVAGNAQVVLSLCQYSQEAAIRVTDSEGTTVAIIASGKAATDGALATVNYQGPATTLTFKFTKGESYLHKMTVYNVNNFVEKDAATGWYIVPAGDAAAFLLALNSANAETGATIFLPDGTYDLGETTSTTISGKNLSIIGESMEGTIIKNAPNVKSEGLGKADLFYNTSTGLYMQDLTLQNDLDYYAAGAAGRAAALQDNGNQTILRNVALRSYQDTYYSKSGNYYFEGGLIQGTVDYICGGGNAFFENITLLNKSREAGKKTGDDTMTAYNGTGKYVFNNCSVESECSTFNFGRSWADAYVVYLNTTIKSGKIVDTRFSTSDMNKKPRFFGEYNTTDLSGNGKNTPASNKLTTSLGASFESVLTKAQAEEYSYDNFFSGWDPKTIAAQANSIDDGHIYLVDGVVTTEIPAPGSVVRVANARGGFGEPYMIPLPETVEVSIEEIGYATLCSDKDLDFTGSPVKAYIAISAEGNTVKVKNVTKVPAYQGVLLAGDNDTYEVTVSSEPVADFATNYFVGLLEEDHIYEKTGIYTNCYLGVDLEGKNPGFYMVNGEQWIRAGKAYLSVPLSDADVTSLKIVFEEDEDDATAADVVEAAPADEAADCYTLTGVKVARASSNGIFIINGKKVVK